MERKKRKDGVVAMLNYLFFILIISHENLIRKQYVILWCDDIIVDVVKRMWWSSGAI